MYNFLELVLSPIIWLMEKVLNIYYLFTNSLGISILLLSFTFALLLLPIQNRGRIFEERINSKIKCIDTEVAPLKMKLKGEQLFKATEAVYQKYNYHPIHSVATGTSFFLILPILISAIILFIDNPILDNQSFLIITDLSKQDQLLGPVNILPVLMCAITLLDARLRYKNDIRSQIRFLIIAIVLLVLVYQLPAGLVLYWTGNNIFALCNAWITARRLSS